MAKDKERAAAKQLFLQGKLQTEISEVVGVEPKTISSWVTKYGWKAERDARMNGNKTRVENLRELIGSLTDSRLKLIGELETAKKGEDKEAIKELNKESLSLADEVSKWTKALDNLDTENRLSLTVYIEVMDSIFHDLQKRYPKLYQMSLDFQEEHISNLSLKYT